VQNPKINGADLFTAGTINGTAVTLSWDPPAISTPLGYTVAIMSPVTSFTAVPGGTLPVGAIGTVEFLSSTTLSTAMEGPTWRQVRIAPRSLVRALNWYRPR
jgi:hypothetical protein